MKRGDWFEKLLRDIVSLRIQGAEAVARAGIEGLARMIRETKHMPPKRAVERLLAARPTEPMLQNAVRYFLEHAAPGKEGKIRAHLLHRFDDADGRIASYAVGLMKHHGTYFTHCHSSTVIHALLKAKWEGKHITVHNTETRPLYQGRKTAKELAESGIKVTHGVDSAARVLLKDCDAVLLGADALLKDGKVANKIGSEMIAELAHARGIPVYVLASSWKYANMGSDRFKGRLEKRDGKEVWQRPPKSVTVTNDAFELIEPKIITAIITELGIRDPRTCVTEIARRGF